MLFFRHFTVFLAALVLMAGPSVAMAAVSIGILDVQKILLESDAARSVQKQIQKRRDKFIEEISQQEQSLRTKEKELSEFRATLSADEFASKKQEFEKEFVEARRIAQKRKKSLDEAGAKALNKLSDELQAIVKQIAQEKGYTLILSKQDVVLSDDSVDISTEAMSRLNKAVSEITLEAPKE